MASRRGRHQDDAGAAPELTRLRSASYAGQAPASLCELRRAGSGFALQTGGGALRFRTRCSLVARWSEAQSGVMLEQSRVSLCSTRATEFLPHGHRRPHHRGAVASQGLRRRCGLHLHGGGGRLNGRDVSGLRRRGGRLPARRCSGRSRWRCCRHPRARIWFGRSGFPPCFGSFRNLTRHLGVACPELCDAGFQFLDLLAHRGEILRHRLQLRRLRGRGGGGRCGGLFGLGRRRRLRGGLICYRGLICRRGFSRRRARLLGGGRRNLEEDKAASTNGGAQSAAIALA